MILDYNQMTFDSEFGSDLFFGKIDESPEENWSSSLPDDLQELALGLGSDPAAYLKGVKPFERQKIQNDALKGKIPYNPTGDFARAIANTALYNVVNASRQLIGMTMRTVGIPSGSFGIVRNIFREEASVALSVANMAKAFVDSELFERALDMLGLIPVVGWIAKIVIEVAQSIAQMVTVILDSRLDTARAVAAQELTIPMKATQFSKDADNQVVRDIYGLMRDGGQQFFIEPAYGPLGSGGEYLGFTAEGVYNDGEWARREQQEHLAAGWVIQPGQLFGGMGFVPGTGNISRSLFFPAGLATAPGSTRPGCRPGSVNAMRDLGSLYPTASALLNSWWSLVLKPGPSMFSVDVRGPIKNWENNIWGMLALGPNLMRGWTCAPTGIPFTNQFWCTREMMDKERKRRPGVGDCEWKYRGTKRKLPSDFGRGAHVTLMGYLYQLHFGLEKLSERTKDFNPDLGIGIPKVGRPRYYKDSYGRDWLEPDSVDISESVAVRALNNLHARQMATLKSINCMYVDGENRDRFGNRQFAALNDKALRKQWYKSVTAIMSGNDWRQVTFADVPEGRMKNELATVIKRHGMDPEKLNPPCPPGAPMSHPCRQMHIRAAPTALGDPKLPAPPGAVRVLSVKALPAKKKTGRRKKKAPSGTIIAAAAVGAFLLLKK